MARHRIALTHRKQRSILTDMLPFEVPPTFSNRGFYRFLRDNSVEIDSGRLRWSCATDNLDVIMRILFGVNPGATITLDTVTEWGKTKIRRSVPINSCEMVTIPFNFRVAHKLDGRTLSVVHPRNQVDVASFYANYSALITYYTSKGEFSIRRPVSVSKYAYFMDKLHELKLDGSPAGVEEDSHEYEQLGSYFVYRKYRNIHRFFESYKYHRAEKKYDAMIQIDVSKCFDSIYTHSLPWAIIGKSQIKLNMESSKRTFSGKFDSLMQRLNHNETNGIVIGPEFSRIFAEIILQSIDVDVQRSLLENHKLVHKVDYELFRYVDDYFVFFNKPSTQVTVLETIQAALKTKKLSVNTAKIKLYEKPIITEITVAKERVSTLLNEELSGRCDETPAEKAGDPPIRRLTCAVDSNRLIVRYKAALKESHVEYGDLLNYTFAIVENKIGKIFKAFLSSDRSRRDQKSLLQALVAIMEFAFFAYSASPKVNHTIRICRMVATAVRFLRSHKLPYELKHLLFKYVYDNILQQLDKNTMSVHREVESLYLITCLTQIGREYWLPESTLAEHFMLEADSTGSYSRQGFLNHFSITVLFSYTRNKVRYRRLQSFIEQHTLEKLDYMKAHCPNDAEAMLLLLDLTTCPYVEGLFKEAVASRFGLGAAELLAVRAANDYWFTAWGERFDLSRELDAKRSREVY